MDLKGKMQGKTSSLKHCFSAFYAVIIIIYFFFNIFSIINVESLLLHYQYAFFICCDYFYTYFGVFFIITNLSTFGLQMSGTNFNGLHPFIF